MLCVEKAVVCVLVTCDADRREVVVVDPDLGGGVDVNEILPLGRTVQFQVADDHVVGFADLEATVGDAGVGADAEHTGVAEDLDDAAAGQSALDLDDATGLCGSCQTSTVRYGGSGSASSTSGASCETDELVNGSSSLLHGSSLGGASGRESGSDFEETHVDSW